MINPVQGQPTIRESERAKEVSHTLIYGGGCALRLKDNKLLKPSPLLAKVRLSRLEWEMLRGAPQVAEIITYGNTGAAAVRQTVLG